MLKNRFGSPSVVCILSADIIKNFDCSDCSASPIKAMPDVTIKLQSPTTTVSRSMYATRPGGRAASNENIYALCHQPTHGTDVSSAESVCVCGGGTSEIKRIFGISKVEWTYHHRVDVPEAICYGPRHN